MKRILVFTIAALIIQISSAQVAPFGIALESIDVPGVGGLQSYALGQHEGKWLVIGGRLDGLHRRQPWARHPV